MWKEIFDRFFTKPAREQSNQSKRINKKREGHWKEYSQHGILLREGDYRNGLKTGRWKLYYETGELAIEETYFEGKKDGPFHSYYQSGRPISEGQYENGKREGRFNIFDHSGKLVKTMVFKEDELIEEEVFEKKAEGAPMRMNLYK